MENDDIRSAWRSLDQRLQRDRVLQLELLRDSRSSQARRNLRPLAVGLLLQSALGLGLVLLGVACWTRNLHAPALLADGIALHAFGVLNLAMAGIIATLAATLDYTAPVLAIQKRLRLMLRMQVLNSNACGVPWWIAWLLVVVGFAGLSPSLPVTASTPTWIGLSLAIGGIGMAATWLWIAKASRKPDGLYARIDDGTGGIRRNLRLFDDLERFERD